MGRLMFWVLLLVALFSGYWFVASYVVQEKLQGALANARNDGWQIDLADLGMTGFPGDFALQMADPAVVPPDGQWAWSGPALQVMASSISPTRPTVVFPATQNLRFGDQMLQIDTADLRLGAALKMNAALHFTDGFAALTDANVVSDAGWQVQLSKVDALMAVVEGSRAAYNLDITLADLVLPDDMIAQGAALGPRISSLRVDAVVTFDEGLNRLAFSGAVPNISRVDLTVFDLIWGDVTMQAAGALDIDDAGVPTGQITLKSAQWQAMIDILVAMGALDAGIAPTLANMARTMAGEDGILELPINFSDGLMSMGFLPLGPAPILR